MKKRNKGLTTALIFIAILLITFSTFAAASLDSVLLQINVSGRADYGWFRTQMTLSYNISAKQVDYYYSSKRMTPGDIFMVFTLASICRVSVDRVVKVYGVQKKNGWGVIAKELGVKPGSREFKLLKGKADGFYGKLKLKNANSSSGNSSNANSSSGKKGGKK